MPHEWRLGRCVRLAIESVGAGKAALQRGVFERSVVMGSEVVAECELLDPERAAERDQVQVMRAERRRRLAQPVHHVGAVRRVTVLMTLEDGHGRTRGLETLDA